ncbi:MULTISPECIES: T9SS outer membrane translocon Sov/SprA [Chitinophagaceae]
MSLKRYSFFLIIAFGLLAPVIAHSQTKDSLPYPIKDRRGDALLNPSYNPFDVRDTSLFNRTIVYDSISGQYVFYEKIGDTYYRMPTELSLSQLLQLRAHADENQYFNDKSRALDLLNFKQPRPRPRVSDNFFNRTFGVVKPKIGQPGMSLPGDSSKRPKLIDIRPQGNIDLKLGYQGQYVNNPTLSENARRTGGFDMNADINFNAMATIGDKMTLPISWNSQANFDYENQIKLRYNGYDDEILKSIEAGNMSFQTKGTLMSSIQNLMGIKAKLQFGKLFVTAAVATSRSQKQSLTLQSGGVSQTINKMMDDYDENRNFLLGQYFRNKFNYNMANLPVTRSQVNITRMEVWVTNRTGTITNARNVVGLMDLGESKPYNSNIHAIGLSDLPDNGNNDIYNKISNSSMARNGALASTFLQSQGLATVQDFEKVYARQLTQGVDYTFNPSIGFIALNSQLQSDDVLGVAYQYTYNGRTYQVGEFSTDVALDSTSGIQKVLYLKLLKATAQRIDLPIWKLMMKNVYTLDVAQVDSSSFRLSVYYKDVSGGTNRALPQSSAATSGQAILSIVNGDRLNALGNPQPDGNFDYLNGFTVLPQQGRIIFPVLEPFGHDLDSLAFQGVDPSISQKYVYAALYDSIKSIAQTYTNLNRFALMGTVKGSSSSTISLGAVNIPQGSVIVTAGGQILIENTDFTIDYASGTLQILNQGIASSGQPINVQFENNTTTTMQRSFMGLRLDYIANKKLSIGATMEKLTERPYTTQTFYGEDPINNTMYGVDFNYKSEWPAMTRWLNKLPNYSSKTMSAINAYGEAALLKPGQPSQIGAGSQASVYIDNFESANSGFDLRYPLTSWALASTPAGNGLFPEATLMDTVAYNNNRAKIAWYNIEAVLQDKNNSNNPLRHNLSALSDLRTRAVYNQELFPEQSTTTATTQLTTFDISYYPQEKGPYNFNASSLDLDNYGHFKAPKSKWGGLMRAIPQTDFETNNIEYIEFWVQDPFLYKPASTGGKLVFNLGNVSEDILKDGKRFYENGLSAPSTPSVEDSATTWGKVPLNPIQLTNAFSNTASDRPYQDVGFDGLNDAGEQKKRANYLAQIASTFGANSPFYLMALADPSNDNYIWYRDPSFDQANSNILTRYKNYNNPQGNSAVATNTTTFSPAATMYPDNEDLNGDNTLNESEDYFEYDLNLKPNMQIGDGYIVDKRTITPKLANDSAATENWYLFRVPVKNFDSKIGSISDFKSIRFIRMYLTGFEDSVTLRFARLNLVRNQWRNFTYYLDTTGNYTSLPTTSITNFNVSSVNLEDNSGRLPIPYKMPPGVERIQSLANNGVNVLQNEQSMALQVTNLQKGDARAVIKGMNMDLRRYGQLNMWIHAEAVNGQRAVADNELNAVIRIGQDYLNNYYEIKIPLKITAPSAAATPEQIWPTSNELNLALQDLVQLKLRRNNSGQSPTKIYRETASSGQVMSVMGNPNLAAVSGFLIGIENPNTPDALSAEMWVDELRLSNIDNQGGWAALGRVDMQLADLGTLSVSGNTYSAGWGSIDQSTNERAMSSMLQMDASTSLNVGKLFPQRMGFSIPVYASINRTVFTPKYDPYDQDVLYKTKMAMAGSKAAKDSIRKVALDQSTTKMFNFSNVRFGRMSAHPKLWSLSNFDFSYSYSSIVQSSPTVEGNNITRHQGGFGYTFNGQDHFYYPFRKLFKNKSPWLGLLRDFNFNPVPSLMSFRVNIDRQMGIYMPRSIALVGSNYVQLPMDTTYDKYFLMDRYYNLRWQLTKNLNLDYSAINNSVVDEPYGALDTKAKKDSVWRNFWKGGRTITFQQKSVLSYNLPLDKLPLTDWIRAQYNYSTGYNWIAANLLARDLGNIVENSRQGTLQADLDFTRLYNKSAFLRKANEPSIPNQPPGNVPPGVVPKGISDTAHMQLPLRDSVVYGLHGAEKRAALKKWRALRRAIRRAKKAENAILKQFTVNGIAKTGAQILTLVKHVNIQYNSGYNSRVPGLMTTPNNFGNNWKTNSPGLAYSLLGKQPDAAWMDNLASKGLLSRDSLFNDVFTSSYTQTLNVTAQLQPLPNLNIDVTLQKSFSQQYNELFKDTLGNGTFEHLSPYAAGGFNMSYISLKTMFTKHNKNEASQLFQNFSNFRTIISKRMGARNPYSQGSTGNYANGYGQYAQDVLIPAFIAAYSGKDPNTIPLVEESFKSVKTNPLGKMFPLPNWRITYSGLTNIPALASIFSNITFSHAYNANLGMNSFTSALNYYDPLHLSTPGFINPTTGNFIPFYMIPNITITEQFQPLIGLDMTTTTQNNIRFQYAKSRTLSLSLTDYQVSEVNSTQFTIGGSWRKRNANLSFLPGSGKARQGNDLNVSLDLAFRNDLQYNSVLDQSSSYSTGGQKVISISPSIDYILNNRINLKLYFDQQRVIPYISTTSPMTTTSAGLQIRVSLAGQ